MRTLARTLCLVAAITSVSTAAPILDVEIFPSPALLNSPIWPSRHTAQTYQHTLAGQVTEVQVLVSRSANAQGNLLVSLRPTTFVNPLWVPVESDGLSFGTISVAVSSLPVGTPTFVSVDVTTLNITASVGVTYAVMLTTDQGLFSDVTWHGTGTTSFYGPGTRFTRTPPTLAWTGTNGDLGLRIFVDQNPVAVEETTLSQVRGLFR